MKKFKYLLSVLLFSTTIFLTSCTEDEKKEKSSSINSCLVGFDWCTPNCSNPTMAWKFSSDGNFNYSTTMFGGMSAWGTWEDVGNKNIKIVYTRTSTGDVLPEKTISMPDCSSLKVGSTLYKK